MRLNLFTKAVYIGLKVVCSLLDFLKIGAVPIWVCCKLQYQVNMISHECVMIQQEPVSLFVVLQDFNISRIVTLIFKDDFTIIATGQYMINIFLRCYAGCAWHGPTVVWFDTKVSELPRLQGGASNFLKHFFKASMPAFGRKTFHPRLQNGVFKFCLHKLEPSPFSPKWGHRRSCIKSSGMNIGPWCVYNMKQNLLYWKHDCFYFSTFSLTGAI
jgi:hypothetical protein